MNSSEKNIFSNYLIEIWDQLEEAKNDLKYLDDVNTN